MFANDKVIWKEGLFLQPQHFQQSERFLINTMQSLFSSYNRYYFGLLNFRVNTDALANKTFTLNIAQGVFPDGTYFSIPETGDVPVARNFADHFSHEQSSLKVYLALPLVLPGRAAVTDSKDSLFTARYKSITQSLSEEIWGQQNKDIELAKANYSILFEDESLDSFTTLPIARLIRSTNGQIILDNSFIPPLLSIGVSSMLNDLLRSLLELLVAKCNNLSQSRKQLEGGFAEFSAQEITPLSLLKTINTYLPVINNHYKSKCNHPYELYLTLIQLSGALCTFSAHINASSLPVYDHASLESVFSQIDQNIRYILAANISAGCIQVPFSEIGPATYLFEISDQKLFDSASFFIGIEADIPEKELVAFSLPRIKISTRNQIDTLIQSAMPGIPLMYVTNPPANLSSKPGYVYLELNQRNKFWEMIKTTGSIALYFPHKFSSFNMEMLAVIK